MDTNQRDRAALSAKRCPDCGKPVTFEEIGPWCRTCDVWFEFNISGWVIRNSDAARTISLVRAATRARRSRGRRKDLAAVQLATRKRGYAAYRVNEKPWADPRAYAE